MKKRNKIIISTMSGLVATTSVIAPLSSCANQQNENALYQQIDKEYGVTSATYEKLKGSFENEVNAYIIAHPEKATWARDEYNRAITNFDKLSTTNKNGWTALTSAMVDHVRNTFGFKLARQSSVKWSQLASIYNGMAKSMRTYMESSKFAPTFISKILTESRAKFDAIEKNLKAKYGNDALGGMIEAKKQIITCFEDTNDEIALVSATQRLADFADEYHFEYIEESEENRLDQLNLKEDQVIDTATMNKLFKITKKSDPDKLITFEPNKMIPMFTIVPKLKKIQDDKAANVHMLYIDLSLIKSFYLTKYTPEKQEAVTAHLRDIDPVKISNQIENNAKTSLNEIIQDLPIETLQFAIQISASEEQKNIEDIYFNSDISKAKIAFKWANKEDQAYEAFFDGTKQDKDDSKHWTGTIDEQALCNAGLQVGYINGEESHYALIDEYFKSMEEKEESIRQNGVSDTNRLSLIETFLTNCYITSEIDIKEDDFGNNLVKNKLNIRFKNSKYDPDSASIKKDVDDCHNYLISNEYYEMTNCKFEKVYRFVHGYLDRKLNQPEKDSEFDYYSQMATTIGTGVLVGAQIIYIFVTWKESTVKARIINLSILFFELLILACEGVRTGMYKKYLYDEIRDFNKNVNAFVDKFEKDEDEKYEDVRNMIARMDSDKNEWFVISDDNGNYNQNEVNEKKAKFRALGHDAMYINQYYSTIMDSEPMKLFVHDQEEMGAEKEALNAILSDWDYGGPRWLISFGLVFLTLLLSLVTLYLNKKNKDMRKEKPVEPGPGTADYHLVGDLETGYYVQEGEYVLDLFTPEQDNKIKAAVNAIAGKWNAVFQGRTKAMLQSPRNRDIFEMFKFFEDDFLKNEQYGYPAIKRNVESDKSEQDKAEFIKKWRYYMKDTYKDYVDWYHNNWPDMPPL